MNGVYLGLGLRIGLGLDLGLSLGLGLSDYMNKFYKEPYVKNNKSLV